MAISKVFDETIADADGTTNLTGFMLAPKDGERDYGITDATVIPARRLDEGEMTHADQPPDVESVMFQEQWAFGMGGDTDRESEGFLFKGRKIDASVPGEIQLAPELNVTTVDSTPNEYISAGFSTAPVSGGSNQGVFAFVGRDVYLWNFTTLTWDIQTEPAASQGTYAVTYRNAAVIGDDTYAPGWLTNTDANPAEHPGATWEGAPYQFIWRSASDWALVPAEAADATTKHPTYMVTTQSLVGTELIVGGNFTEWNDSLGDINDSGGISDSDTSVVVTSVASFEIGDYIRVDVEIMRISNISSNTLTIERAALGTTAAAQADGDDIYLLIHQPQRIRTSTSPKTDANWSSASDIGSRRHPITGVQWTGTRTLISKTNGVWALFQDGTDALLTKGWDSHPDNGKGSHYWNGRLLIPKGNGDLFELLDDDTTHDISLRHYMPDDPAMLGRVVAITSTAARFYLMVEDAVHRSYHIVSGEWLDGDYRWHHMGSIGYTTASKPDFASLFYEGEPGLTQTVFHDRIWAGIYSTGSNLFPHFLAFEGDAEAGFTNDGGGTVATHTSGATVASGLSADATVTTFVISATGFVREDDLITIESEVLTVSGVSGTTITVQRGMLGTTAATHANATAIFHTEVPQFHLTTWDKSQPRLDATFQQVEIESRNLGTSGRLFTAQYRIDKGVWLEDLTDTGGNADGVVDVSRNQTLTFPDGTTGKRIELRFFPALTAKGTTGPEFIDIKLTGQIRPAPRRIRPFRYYLAAGQILRNGAQEARVKAKLAQLRTWNDQASEVTHTDAEGTARKMVFLPGTLVVEEVGDGPSRSGDYVATGQLAEV